MTNVGLCRNRRFMSTIIRGESAPSMNGEWWYRSRRCDSAGLGSTQKQSVLYFCKKSSKTMTKKDSPNTPLVKNPRRIKKDPHVNAPSPSVPTLNVVSSSNIVPTSGTSSSIGAGNDFWDPSTSTNFEATPDVQFLRVYVHPLSQIVLNHFQMNYHEWIRSKRLDQNLIVNSDGSFVLSSPSDDSPAFSSPTAATTNRRIVLNPNNNGRIRCDMQSSTSGASVPATNPISIWTNYDMNERKYWLYFSIMKNGALQKHSQYLLQDERIAPWQGISLHQNMQEHVQNSIHQLIDAVNQSLP
jgi:hypothetical protein